LQTSKRITTLEEMSARGIKRAWRTRNASGQLEGEPVMHLGRQARNSGRPRISAVKHEKITSKRLQQRIVAAALNALLLETYAYELPGVGERNYRRPQHRKEIQEGIKQRNHKRRSRSSLQQS
jgi:hypothetical protein